MAEDEEPRAPLISCDLNAELDGLIAELGTHSHAEGELREVKEGVYVSLSQSQPEGFEYALPEFGRTNAFRLQEGSGILQLRNILHLIDSASGKGGPRRSISFHGL